MKSKITLHICLLLSAIGISLGSLAADAETSTAPAATRASVATFRQLDELRSQNALLAEAAKAAELRNKVNGAGSGGSLMPNGAQATSQTPSNGSASVLMVSGSPTQPVAHISTPGGGQVQAKVGTRIAGVGTVKSISTNEVVVADRNELLSLPFATESSFSMGGAR